MRKRIKIEGAVKILSCINGKIVRYTFVILSAVICSMFASCQPDDSWLTYCNKYNVNPDNPTEEQCNFYLDCYVGSVEEECDLM